MTVRRHRTTTALLAVLACVLVTVVGAGAAPGAVRERDVNTIAGTWRGASSVGSGGVGLSIPRPTGRHPVGVRSTFVRDATRIEPRTGAPRAIPTRVWYPAERRRGPAAAYFSAPVQAFVEEALRGFGVPAPAGLFDVDTHATVAAAARRHVSGVLLFMGGFGTPFAFYSGLIADLASHGYAVVAFDHPHDTVVVEQPNGLLIEGNGVDDAAAFQARLLDIDAVLDALAQLVPQARRHTPIGILGHSNGGEAAGEAMLRQRELRAGVNLDGFIPGGAFLPGRLLSEGLDRPFGLMLGLDVRPEDLREYETFLSNMRAPHPVRRLDIHHYGFSDFVVFNPQAQQADRALGTALETTIFSTGTLDSLAAGRRALTQQRAFLVGFFDRYLNPTRGDGAGRSRPRR